MKEHDFKTFEEFWPFYVREHSKKGTRTFHFVGTSVGMALVGAGLLFRKRWLVVAGPVVGYLSSWTGHFFVEKNIPATFKHPLWSLRADFVMWSKIVDGTMDAEVERILGSDTATNGTAEVPTAHDAPN